MIIYPKNSPIIKIANKIAIHGGGFKISNRIIYEVFDRHITGQTDLAHNEDVFIVQLVHRNRRPAFDPNKLNNFQPSPKFFSNYRGIERRHTRSTIDPDFFKIAV